LERLSNCDDVLALIMAGGKRIFTTIMEPNSKKQREREGKKYSL
jgi:hypothetical protein